VLRTGLSLQAAVLPHCSVAVRPSFPSDPSRFPLPYGQNSVLSVRLFPARKYVDEIRGLSYKNRMKYVILGTGNISNTYVAALKNIQGSTLVGCISRSKKKPTSAPDLPCWESLSQVDTPFDAVIVTTPNGLHHKGALEAAVLKKHILIEKPLEITRDAMNAIILSSNDAGVTLAVSYQRRTAPDNQALHKLFSTNAFGRIYAADLSCKFWRDQKYYDSSDYRGSIAIDGGGPFIQQACHNIDLYIWFFGMPAEVSSMLGTFAHTIEGEDHGAALLRYKNGMIGTIIASTSAYPGYPARLEVLCEKGSFVTLDDVITEWNINGIPNPSTTKVEKHEGSHSAAVTNTAPHEAIINDFEDAIRSKRQPVASAESSRLTTELILQIYGR
jgi:UDP-N-acetyl-2-amino-2-deoxyglucuronate dehydrogenase